MEMLVFKHIKIRFYFSKTKDFMFQILLSADTCFQMCYSRKNPNGEVGVKGILKGTLDLICPFTLVNSRESKTFVLDIPQSCMARLGNSKAKNQDRWKFRIIFFLITDGNSSSFSTDHLNFNMFPL